MAQSLTLEEKETILRFSEVPDDLVVFETFNKAQALRLIDSGAEAKATRTYAGSTYWTLRFPKSLVSLAAETIRIAEGGVPKGL